MPFLITLQPAPLQQKKVGESYGFYVTTSGADITAGIAMYKNGALFTPASGELIVSHTPAPLWLYNLNFTRNNLSASDEGTYIFRFTYTGGSTDTNNAVLSIKDRLSLIALEIKTLIEAMTVAGGYYNNWGTCNIFDAALRKVWPEAVITYQLQAPAGDLSHYYGMLNAEFTMEVEAKIVPVDKGGSVKAVHESNSYLNTALADLIKLFLQNNGYLPLTTEAVITFKEAYRETGLINGDVFRPSKLITKWNVHYLNS